jgi:hypothetical protein
MKMPVIIQSLYSPMNLTLYLCRSQNNKTSSLLPALGRDSNGPNPKPRQFEIGQLQLIDPKD